MKRWPIKFDCAVAGHVYAETVEAARRAARASYKRIHPDRDPVGRARVENASEEVASEAAEARAIVSQVYEGLRLLPGMEMPAEKLRSAVILLESAVARDRIGAGPSAGLAAAGGGGGDTELQEALSPVLDSKLLPTPLKSGLRGLLEWVGINTPPEKRRQIELKMFQALWEAGLIDLRYQEQAPSELHRASAYLTERLVQAGALRIERLDQVEDVDALKARLKRYGKEAAKLQWSFVPDRDGPAAVRALRPLVLLGETILQPARVMRGVGNEDHEAVAFDNALFDVLQRLQNWDDSLGRIADVQFNETQRQLMARTMKRIISLRKTMAKAAKEGGDVLPADTARRDLIKFVIDQVHRMEDALSLLADRSLRDAFGNLVFKDVVFRGAGTYLTERFGISIDTAVVEGADTEGLVGRFKKEPGKPRPKQETNRIHSVVVPCYTQDGVAIRPAQVRVGVYA